MSYAEAATIPLAAALQALQELGNIKSGQTVLLNGASGGVGILAVQIAKALGAEVTGVCSSKNLELVKSLNADIVIDYTQQDFTKGNVQYDIIFDVVAKQAFSDCRKVFKWSVYFYSPSPRNACAEFFNSFSARTNGKISIGEIELGFPFTNFINFPKSYLVNQNKGKIFS